MRPPKPKQRSPWRYGLCAALAVLCVAAGVGWHYRSLRAPLLAAVAPVQADPAAAAVVVLKSERRMELWQRSGGVWRKTRDYGLMRVRGVAGPKLAAHDGQVPEGVYALRSLSPLTLDYPNDFDRRMARRDLRNALGDGFLLNGNAVQADAAVWQDVSAVLSAVGREQVHVVVVPNDLRIHPPVKSGRPVPNWVPELYVQLTQALKTDFGVARASNP
jgi:hypothetical protein